MIYFTHLPSYAKIIPPPKCPMTVKAIVRECITFDFFFLSTDIEPKFYKSPASWDGIVPSSSGSLPHSKQQKHESDTPSSKSKSILMRGTAGSVMSNGRTYRVTQSGFTVTEIWFSSIFYPLPTQAASTRRYHKFVAVFASRCLLSHPSRKAKRNNTGSIHYSTQPMPSFRFWIIPLWWLPSLWHHHVPASIYEQKRCGKRIWPPNARSARNRKDPNSINFPPNVVLSLLGRYYIACIRLTTITKAFGCFFFSLFCFTAIRYHSLFSTAHVLRVGNINSTSRRRI